MDYNFSALNGEFTGATPFDESPLEPGVYLHPAYSTTTPPPAVADKQAAVFANGAWSIVPDHRGETWYEDDGGPVTVEALGDPAQTGLLAIQPNHVAPQPMPARYSKKKLFEAMTDAEYETFEATESGQTAKDRRVFREATELSEADPGFAKVLGLMQAAYGEDRAAELLAAAEI